MTASPPADPTPESERPDVRGAAPTVVARRRSRSRRGVLIAVVGALVGAIVGVAGAAVTATEYTSEAQVQWNPGALDYLSATPSQPATPDLLDRQVADQRDVVTSDQVVEGVAAALSMDVDELRDAVAVDIQPGSSLLTISATAADPEEAARIATALTDGYVSTVENSGVDALTQQADLRQASIDRLTQERDALTAELNDLSNRLGGLSVNSAAYAVTQTRLAGVDARLGDVLIRLNDARAEQESLRASAEAFPGQAFRLRAATVPEAPSSLSTTTGAILGGALGLFLGVCVVLFLYGRHSRWHRNTPADRSAG
ncbi:MULTISPECIES: hypothetical protein [unclassified Blastococcus]